MKGHTRIAIVFIAAIFTTLSSLSALSAQTTSWVDIQNSYQIRLTQNVEFNFKWQIPIYDEFDTPIGYQVSNANSWSLESGTSFQVIARDEVSLRLPGDTQASPVLRLMLEADHCPANAHAFAKGDFTVPYHGQALKLRLEILKPKNPTQGCRVLLYVPRSIKFQKSIFAWSRE